ncbi:MAG TPA: hypothetical protein EYP29_00075 [Thermoplasmata archaeon]|nr:hypothetical protein [Thermoplasmata archaeon]
MRRRKRGKKHPPGYWKVKENRVRAIREMVEKLNKPVDEIKKKDFHAHHLSSVLNFYHGSVAKALLEAGFQRKKIKKEDGYWEKKENRVEEVRALVSRLGKSPDEIKKKDFFDNHLTMLFKYGSLKELLEEAGYTLQKTQKPKGYWNSRENRVKAIREFVENVGKPLNKITKKDFIAYGLSSLLNRYNGSLWNAIRDAGFEDVKVWRPPGHWNKKENRIKAVRELVQKLGKDPKEITRKDFIENGLGSLLNKYRDEVCKDFERGDIFTFDKGYLLRYKTLTERALAESGVIE